MSDDSSMTGDWAREQENYDFLRSLAPVPMRTAAWKSFQRPAEVDTNWHQTENQGSIGSCQGHSMSSVLERLAIVNGEKIQLSEIFAYLATQKIDGLLGADNGSTISGGCELAVTVGCCLEELTGYPRSYPSRSDRERILSSTIMRLRKSTRLNRRGKCRMITTHYSISSGAAAVSILVYAGTMI